MIKDFLEAYKDYVFDRIDTPLVFIEASAYHIISATLSRFFYYPSIEQETRPNVMFLLSSIPGRTRRSTLASIDREIYKSAYKQIVKPIKSEYDLDELVYESIIEEGSPEGILDGILGYKEKVYGPHNIDYQSTEFGDILKTMSGKNASYHRGIARIMSKTYYGEGTKVNLSVHGRKSRYLPPGIYSTMFGGMQEAGMYIDPYHANQGLLRRVIIVTPDGYRYKPFLDIFREKHRDVSRFSGQIKRMYDKILLSFDKIGGHIPVYILTKAEKELNRIDEIRGQEVVSDSNYGNLIKQSDSEHITKLATLEAINNLNMEDDGLIVNLNHFKKAKDFFDRATRNNDKFYKNIGVVKRDAYSDESQINRVFGYIQSTPISKGTLYKRANITKRDAEPILETLLEQNVIKEIKGMYCGRVTYKYQRV